MSSGSLASFLIYELYAKAVASYRERFGHFILLPSNLGGMVTVPKAREVRIREWQNLGRPLDRQKLDWLLARDLAQGARRWVRRNLSI